MKHIKSINKFFIAVIAFFVISGISPVLLANNLYPLPTKSKDIQFENLLKELRCLVCQNQDLADSNASLAKDLRGQVYNMVKSGKADTEIIDYLTKRYGDFILFAPPVKGLTFMLWFGPLLFLVLGLSICFYSLRNLKVKKVKS